MHAAFYLVLGQAAGAVLLSWTYFRRYQITRPPIGVFNLVDVAVLLGAIVLVPYVYLALPLWLVTALLAASALSVICVVSEPVLRARWAIWPAALALLSADIGAALSFGTDNNAFFAVNNVALIVAVVGISNLWAQSGMKARDVAVLAGALTLYDVIATARLPLMTDLITRLAGIPFTPMLAWRVGGEGGWLGMGVGDLLLAAVFPLVMGKAFGRHAGLVAMASVLSATGGMLALLDLGVVRMTIPAMAVLGPLMVIQYAIWALRCEQELTMCQYRRDEPSRRSAPVPAQ